MSNWGYPKVLAQLPTPPKELYVLGADLADIMAHPRVAMVSSRAVSNYGRQVVAQLAS